MRHDTLHQNLKSKLNSDKDHSDDTFKQDRLTLYDVKTNEQQQKSDCKYCCRDNNCEIFTVLSRSQSAKTA